MIESGTEKKEAHQKSKKTRKLKSSGAMVERCFVVAKIVAVRSMMQLRSGREIWRAAASRASAFGPAVGLQPARRKSVRDKVSIRGCRWLLLLWRLWVCGNGAPHTCALGEPLHLMDVSPSQVASGFPIQFRQQHTQLLVNLQA